jgi:hypothetical protein
MDFLLQLYNTYMFFIMSSSCYYFLDLNVYMLFFVPTTCVAAGYYQVAN